MHATLKQSSYTGKVGQHRKEKHFRDEYVVLVERKKSDFPCGNNQPMKDIINVKLYAVPNRTWGAVWYACVWINSNSIHISGGGKASGCGYHKPSAALANALHDAGVELSQSISGVGESAMTDSLAAIAKSLGYKKFHIHYAHG